MNIIRASLLSLAVVAQPVAADDPENGEALYMLYCATCHGPTGAGDGPMAPALLVPPSDLTALSSREDGRFPLARVVARIDGRDPLVSHGSDMPVWGWFFEGESAALKTESGQPILTTAPIADLVAWLRTVQD